MQHDDRVYVSNMLDCARLTVEKSAEWGRERYFADITFQLALTHLIQLIGEAARNVSLGFREAHPDVPWAMIVGTRHRVVHDYLSVDLEILWNIATKSVPALIPHLEAILAEPNP